MVDGKDGGACGDDGGAWLAVVFSTMGMSSSSSAHFGAWPARHRCAVLMFFGTLSAICAMFREHQPADS